MKRWEETFAAVALERSAETAHDLKTPLNIAVLNLELLKIRSRKVAGQDEKIDAYVQATDSELRRLAHIFDAFFGLVVPPKDEGEPSPVALGPLLADVAEQRSLGATVEDGLTVLGHPSRIRELIRLLMDGSSRAVDLTKASMCAGVAGGLVSMTIRGPKLSEGVEIGKVFKFYYTDGSGKADMALASARLIAETYGGELSASDESGSVSIRLELPQGEK